MRTETDDRVEEYQKLENGGSIFVKLEKDDGIDDDETSKFSRLLSQVGTFILSKSNRKVNHFTRLRRRVQNQ